jgi:hypothetical protein
MHLTLPKIALSVLAAAVIALGISLALGGGGDKDGRIAVYSISSNTKRAPMGVQAAQYDDIGGPGALFMIQGQQARQLMFWPLYGDDDPRIIDSQVSSYTLRPDPTGKRILYSTAGALMVLDVDARRADIVGVLPKGAYPIRAQWSPTGHAVAYVVQQGTQVFAYYTLADGSQVAVPFMGMHEGLGLDVGWLPDGRPVAIFIGVSPAMSGLHTQYTVYDPATHEFSPLPPDSKVIQTWDPWRSPDGTQQVSALQPEQRERFRQNCLTGPLVVFGDEWLPITIQAGAVEYQTIFELYGLAMDSPTWLHDGRIVFRGTADDACHTYPSGLYVGRPGREPEQLVTTDADYSYDQDEKMMWNVLYAINQTETHIAWAENDPDAQRSTIYLMPLDGSSPPEVIYQTPPADDPLTKTYRDEAMILSLVWLP